LAALAREVAREACGEPPAAPVEVVAPGPVVGRWDRSRLEQVVANLVSNACKYGDGKPIEVRVEAHDGRARLRVRDGGLGISREDRARIFQPFERAGGRDRAPGLGLGLYVVRKIVEAHGGRIELESEPGSGSTFTVELPRDLA